MSKIKKINQKKVYNSVVKIITTSVQLDLNIPYNVLYQDQSIGAGFFFDKKGHILTAAHVIENAVDIWIRLPKEGHDNYKAKIISVYPDFDIAIIKIQNYKNTNCLTLGNSDKVNIQDKVYTIGYPKNPKYPIVTSGIISGNRDDFIQTDTPVNPGNSGGPLLNNKNEVIGITSAKIADSENNSLIVPINFTKSMLKSMLNSKEKIIHKNVLGVMLVNGTNNYRDLYGRNKKCPKGIIIKKITNNSPLNGLVEEGDLITSFNNGKEYPLDYYGETNVEWESGKVSLDNLIKRCIPGEKIKLRIWSVKKGKCLDINVKLKNFKEIYPIRKIFPHIDKIDYEVFGGMILSNLTLNHLQRPEFAHLIYLIQDDKIYKEQLVITHIFPNSKIAEYNTISPYSLISKINNIKVRNLTEFRKAIKKPIKKKNNTFLIIETSNKDKVIINIKELLEQEQELIKLYNYEQSKLVKYFVNFFK